MNCKERGGKLHYTKGGKTISIGVAHMQTAALHDWEELTHELTVEEEEEEEDDSGDAPGSEDDGPGLCHTCETEVAERFGMCSNCGEKAALKAKAKAKAKAALKATKTKKRKAHDASGGEKKKPKPEGDGGEEDSAGDTALAAPTY